FLYSIHCLHRVLHSFPTRRSSDLFLKILSYLIENRTIGEKQAIEYFEDKIHDQTILDDLKKAAEITTDVVLFDIDAKRKSDSMADRKSTRLNSSHVSISYAVFCLK